MRHLSFILLVGLIGWSSNDPSTYAAEAVELGKIRLKRQASVEARTILLSDVADLKGYAASRLSAVKVGWVEQGKSSTKVSLAGLRPTLDREGVNWGRLSLGGFAYCRVMYTEPVAELEDEPVAPITTMSPQTGINGSDLLLVNPTDAISIEAVLTVQDRVMQFLEETTGWNPNELSVEFSARDHSALAQLVGHDRLEFEPNGTVGVGRLPIVIRRYRQGQVVGTDRLTADIGRKQLVVVATRTLTRGQSIAPGDVEVREVLITKSSVQPVLDINEVIGQVAGRFIRNGKVIITDDVRPPVMVRRGELMSIHCMTDGLLIKTVARASEDGLLGQSIRVRNDQSREQYIVNVTGPKRGQVMTPQDNSERESS